ELVRGHGAGLDELRGAGDLELRVREPGARLLEVGGEALALGVELPPVEPEEDLPGSNDGAFFEADLFDESFDARPELDDVHGGELSAELGGILERADDDLR